MPEVNKLAVAVCSRQFNVATIEAMLSWLLGILSF